MTHLARLTALALFTLASGCVATTSRTTTWTADPSFVAERPGRVEWVRETVQTRTGDPAAGAVAGGIIGGMVGHALTGRGAGTLLGIIGGAAVGAQASQGGEQRRFYEVAIRFDDGAYAVYVYRDASPFLPGDRVAWTPRGFVRLAPAPAPPPGAPRNSPPPPPDVLPPPPGS
jgi:outer membrane lipoprotein SlyB